MKISSNTLLSDLKQRTNQVITQAEELMDHTAEALNSKPSTTSWSALECIEHLNRYGDFYLPELNQRIKENRKPTAPTFKSGMLGNYFAKSLLPKEPLNKMKTFKSMDPSNSKLDKRTVQLFIDQQKQMLSILEHAEKINLNKTKTAISISKWIKLKFGDTLRVVIYHNQRHLLQALRAVNA